MLRLMTGAGPPEPPETSPGARRQKAAAGSCVGYLIFALFLLLLIFYDVKAVTEHAWANVAGATAFILIFVMGVTGGAKRLDRLLRHLRSPEPPRG